MFVPLLNFLCDRYQLQRIIGAKHVKISSLHDDKLRNLVLNKVKWRPSWIYANEGKHVLLQLLLLY